MNKAVLKTRKNDTQKVLLALYLLVFLLLLFGLNKKCEPYAIELILLFSSYILVGLVFAFRCYLYEVDIFEPLLFCTVLMLAIFIITPIIDICNGETRAFGIDVMNYCVEGTIIFDLSYIAFCLGYSKKYKTKKNKQLCLADGESSRKTIVLVVIVFYIFCYLLALIDQMTHGINWEYILSFGASGLAESEAGGLELGFMGLFANSLLTCWLIYLYYGKSKILKIILGFFTFAMYFIRTARHIMFDMLLAPIIMYYLSKDKRPKISLIFTFIILVVIGSGIIAFIRGAVRNGWGVSLEGMGTQDIVNNFLFNLQIYKSYYGVLRAFTERMDYTYGMQILYTIIMIVPRVLWPGKPESYQAEIIGNGLNQQAVVTGYAFPNLGEFYGEFGVIGAIVGYLVFGLLLGYWKTMYDKKSATKVSMLKYSILLPVCLQLIIRGAVYQNFYLVLFLMLPFWIVDIVCDILEKRRFK